MRRCVMNKNKSRARSVREINFMHFSVMHEAALIFFRDELVPIDFERMFFLECLIQRNAHAKNPNAVFFKVSQRGFDNIFSTSLLDFGKPCTPNFFGGAGMKRRSESGANCGDKHWK